MLTTSRAGSQSALDSGGGGAGCWSAESLDNVGDTITDRPPPPPPPRPWDSGRDDEPLAAGRGDDARDAFDDDLSDRARSSPGRAQSSAAGGSSEGGS